MKKNFLIVASLACMASVGCRKESPSPEAVAGGRQEVAFTALSRGFTKSVLGSGNPFAGSGRTIVAAGVVKSEGKWTDFLVPTNFTECAASEWAATPRVYYPLGGADGDYKFLAYSETAIPETGSTRRPVTARWYGSSEVEINVDEKCDTNEIVYSGFVGNKAGAASAVFKHSQALVTVRIRTNRDTIKINRVIFEDVKTSGILNLKRAVKATDKADSVTVNWLFSAGCTCHFAEMGNYNVAEMDTTGANAYKVKDGSEMFFKEYEPVADSLIAGSADQYRNCGLGTWFGTTGCHFSRLFPAQDLEARTMVVNYTIGAITADARLTFADEDSTPEAERKVCRWVAGRHYVYEITVKPTEIVLNPSAEDAWEVHTVTGVLDKESTGEPGTGPQSFETFNNGGSY